MVEKTKTYTNGTQLARIAHTTGLACVATYGNTEQNINAMPTKSSKVRACDPSRMFEAIQFVTLQQHTHKKNEMQITTPKQAMVNETTIQTSFVASRAMANGRGCRFKQIHAFSNGPSPQA